MNDTIKNINKVFFDENPRLFFGIKGKIQFSISFFVKFTNLLRIIFNLLIINIKVISFE